MLGRGARVPGAAQHLKGVYARLRGLWWCAADTDLGFTRDRRLNVRKSGKPDLRGPFQSLAVPDQRCHSASLRAFMPVFDGAMDARDRALWLHFVTRCTASGTRDSVGRVRSLIHFSNSPDVLVPAARFCARGFASLLHSPRIEGWAERRETFGCSGTRWAYHDAIRQAPSEAPCVP
jgi:hypothetical protein